MFVCSRLFSSSPVKSYRYFASLAQEKFAIVYKQHGDPIKVLEGSKCSLTPTIGDKDVFIHMMAAPINPADINMIQGVYPVKPDLPAVGGNEGVGKVMSVGKRVTSLKPGDWVIPATSGSGTWQTAAVRKADDFLLISSDIPLASAATLAVNPCTAYRMLKDFEDLKPGDVVLQNAANSYVGQTVIQIAVDMKLQTVNIIRNRPDIVELSKTLKELGATHVVTDEFLRKPDMKDLMKTLPRPKLALNCVGGKASADLLKYLGKNGTMVIYGGMSKQPLLVPAGPLIFQDVKLKGYWMTKWNTNHHSSTLRKDMLDYICDMIRKGKLKPPPMCEVPIENFKDAIAKAMEPYSTKKQLLIMKN